MQPIAEVHFQQYAHRQGQHRHGNARAHHQGVPAAQPRLDMHRRGSDDHAGRWRPQRRLQAGVRACHATDKRIEQHNQETAMKHLLILLLALPMIAFGQRSLLYPTDNVESIVIKDVIHTQLPKKDMYQNAMQWLVKNTSKHSIQLNDSLNGVVISKVAFIISGEKSCKLLSEREVILTF